MGPFHTPKPRRWAMAAVFLALAACTSHIRASGPSSPGPLATASHAAESRTSGSLPITYQVVAPLLHPRGPGRPLACAAELMSLPSAGCSGVPITGYDFAHMPGVVHAGGAWWTTHPVLLVGIWNGRTLAVTRPPSPRHSQGRQL